MPAEASTQLSLARDVIERHLAPTVLAVHLYGSALDGGLKPCSDIDLLVTVAVRPDEAVRQALLLDLLEVSAPPGRSQALRALEVTVVARDDIAPWRYPPRRELQFGEWLREDIRAGKFEPPGPDADLAILLTQARQQSVALSGPSAEQVFDSVPAGDLFSALAHTLQLWHSPPDWAGDERNVVLTLARIWYSAATGRIVPKDVAADWAVTRLPVELRPVLLEARQAYLGDGAGRLAMRPDQLRAFVQHVKAEAGKSLRRQCGGEFDLTQDDLPATEMKNGRLVATLSGVADAGGLEPSWPGMPLTIREVDAADAPMELLLLADPSEDKVRAYLPGSRCFVARSEGAVVAACVVQPLGAGAHELMNIAVQPAHQRSGHGAVLLQWVIDFFREAGARRIEVGTGSFGYQLAFYQRQGFRVTGIDRDFFVRHYPEPIFENGIRLRDMLRLTLEYRDDCA